jgi:hypothetical protein
MLIKVPSNNSVFQLEMTIKTNHKLPIRILALDPNKPASRYYDRCPMIEGERKFKLHFPVSPKDLEIVVYNEENGDMPFGEDGSFEITNFKVEKLKEYDVWWNQDTKNFYKFAVKFCQNAGILSASKKDGSPSIYRSDDGKFTIDYFTNIRDRQSGRIISTPARIGHSSGIIEVSKAKFLEYTIPMRLVILLHEFGHKYLNPKINREIDYETGADISALYVYLGKGWSPFEANKSFLNVFRKANSDGNHKRFKIVRDFIFKYDRGLVEGIKA